MEVYRHFVISTGCGIFLSIFHPEAALEILAVSLFSGVLIDLDHFIISRLDRGDWRFLKKTIKNPIEAVSSKDKVIIEEVDYGSEKRLLGHAVINSVVLGAGIASMNLLVLTASFSVLIHIVSDLFEVVYR